MRLSTAYNKKNTSITTDRNENYKTILLYDIVREEGLLKRAVDNIEQLGLIK